MPFVKPFRVFFQQARIGAVQFAKGALVTSAVLASLSAHAGPLGLGSAGSVGVGVGPVGVSVGTAAVAGVRAGSNANVTAQERAAAMAAAQVQPSGALVDSGTRAGTAGSAAVQGSVSTTGDVVYDVRDKAQTIMRATVGGGQRATTAVQGATSARAGARVNADVDAQGAVGNRR